MTQIETTTIEDELAAICAKHDLTCIAVDVNLKQSGGSRFGATAHWDGFSTRNIPCTSAHGKTVSEALTGCLIRVREERTPPFVTADLPVLVMEAA